MRHSLRALRWAARRPWPCLRRRRHGSLRGRGADSGRHRPHRVARLQRRRLRRPRDRSAERERGRQAQAGAVHGSTGPAAGSSGRVPKRSSAKAWPASAAFPRHPITSGQRSSRAISTTTDTPTSRSVCPVRTWSSIRPTNWTAGSWGSWTGSPTGLHASSRI